MGDKKALTSGAADISRASGRMTAISRANAGGSVKSFTGDKTDAEKKREQEAANAAKIAAEKAAADAAYKAAQEKKKKEEERTGKKKSAIDIAMGR